MSLTFLLSPLSLSHPPRWLQLEEVLDLGFGSSPRTFIIMTHKSLPAPPVCHVPTHNNCVECLEELSWHGLFVTSGRVTGCGSGSAPAEPGWGGGKSSTNPFCRGFSWGLHGCWEPACSGRGWQRDLRRPRCVGMEHQGCNC